MAPTLLETCQAAGLDELAIEYVTTGQGFTTVMQITKVGKNEDEFMETLFTPFKGQRVQGH